MDNERARRGIKDFKETEDFKSMVFKIENQLGRKLSRVEQDLIAIDSLSSIGINTGKMDELRKNGVKF